MDIVILKIDNKVDSPNAEFIHLISKINGSLKDYAVFDQTYDSEGAVSNKHVHFFKLPVLNIISGDEIVIYTGENINKRAIKEPINNGKNTKYRYFLKFGSKIWNKDHDKASVVKIHFEYTTTK